MDIEYLEIQKLAEKTVKLLFRGKLVCSTSGSSNSRDNTNQDYMKSALQVVRN